MDDDDVVIGGRAVTSSADFGVPFDHGCAWLHSADRNPFLPKAGYRALIHHWGADVPVTLSTPVRRIRWDGPGVAAETGRGTIGRGW